MASKINDSYELLASYPDVLTVGQLSQILHTGRQTTYNLLLDGKIKYRRVGQKYIIAKTSVIEFLHSDEK